MRKELEQKLAESFSFMRKGKSYDEQEKEGFISDVYSAFGLECGDGWYDLIYELCTEITKLYEKHNRPIDLQVNQIKEKFGGLRFYFSIEDDDEKLNDDKDFYDEVSEVVNKCCSKSYEVCEVCGKPGELRNDLPWIRTLCDECYSKAKKINVK